MPIHRAIACRMHGKTIDISSKQSWLRDLTAAEEEVVPLAFPAALMVLFDFVALADPAAPASTQSIPPLM